MYSPEKYRKKPVEIEAMFYDGSTACGHAIMSWLSQHDTVGYWKLRGGLVIPTLEGDMAASAPCYIIKGVNGEFYPCAEDIFRKTHTPVD